MPANEVVPFLAVRSMDASLAFYVNGLGFAMEKKWEVNGAIRWCQLRFGKAGLMLQEFAKVEEHRGAGVTLCFFLDDAVAFYREVNERRVQASTPFVENASGPHTSPTQTATGCSSRARQICPKTRN